MVQRMDGRTDGQTLGSDAFSGSDPLNNNFFFPEKNGAEGYEAVRSITKNEQHLHKQKAFAVMFKLL